MNYFNLQQLAFTLGLSEQPSAKRVVKKRSGWGIETEQLENRALLSASGRGAGNHEAEAHVVGVNRRAPVQFPAISGTWNVTATGDFAGSGVVNITQNGKKVTSTIQIDGLGTFTATGTFRNGKPFELTSKTPRMELPGAPIKLRLTIAITFPQGNLNPTTFSGQVKVPFAGTVASLTATKSP